MSKVRTAVIPVAGYGTRFLPFTKAIPKAMLPIVNKPAVQMVIEEAANSGIERVVLVVGQHSEIINAHFSTAKDLEETLQKRESYDFLELVKSTSCGVEVVVAFQEKQTGTASAVLCAKSFVPEGEPFAVMFGDDVMLSEKPVLKQLIEVYENTQKTVIGVKNVGFDQVGKYASVEYSAKNGNVYEVSAITEKPKAGSAKSDLAPLGRYVCRAELWDILENLKTGLNGEYQFTDALGLESQSQNALAYAFDGKRFDMGDRVGFLKANVEFALENPEISEEFKNYLKNLAKKF